MTPTRAEAAAARLLFPAVRWDAGTGFRGAWPQVEEALDLGVGGFILFGGEAGEVHDLAAELHERAAYPLLLASDLERGAGQQFRGATALPPAAAIGSLGDLEATRRAAEVTAREARALGIGWVLAPVADLDVEPRNPIVGTRAFAGAAEAVSRQVEAWVRGCADGGALSCLKHFPGHGRTVGDSHTELPIVQATRAELEDDLSPFRAGIAAGADAVMAGHLAVPALDPAGQPATRSEPILRRLLRATLRFDGIVATDAINMAGFSGVGGEGGAAVKAVAAGCDALLYPADLPGTARAIAEALHRGELPAERVRDACDRVARAARRAGSVPGGRWGREEDLDWARRLAARTIRVVRGAPSLSAAPVNLLEIDDDLGGPHSPPSREPLRSTLRARGVAVAESGHPLLAVYADVRAWKRRGGLSERARAEAAALLAVHPDMPVLLFGHPRIAGEIPAARHLMVAWGGEPVMQIAAADVLTVSPSS